jgi:hypothetical protein
MVGPIERPGTGAAAACHKASKASPRKERGEPRDGAVRDERAPCWQAVEAGTVDQTLSEQAQRTGPSVKRTVARLGRETAAIRYRRLWAELCAPGVHVNHKRSSPVPAGRSGAALPKTAEVSAGGRVWLRRARNDGINAGRWISSATACGLAFAP